MADGAQIMTVFSVGMALIGLWILSIVLTGLGYAIKKPKLESIGMILLAILAIMTPILLFTREDYILTSQDVIIAALMGLLSGIMMVIGITQYRKIRDEIRIAKTHKDS